MREGIIISVLLNGIFGGIGFSKYESDLHSLRILGKNWIDKI